MAMERFESASSEHGIPIDEARRLVRTSVDRWNEEVLREFAHPEPSPARVRSLKGVLNSLRHLFAPLFSGLEDARKMFEGSEGRRLGKGLVWTGKPGGWPE